MTGVFDQSITKKQLKSKIKEACQNHNDAELKQQIQTYKKMAALRDELKKGNTYFYRDHITNVRTLFRFRVDLFEAKANFKNKYRNEPNVIMATPIFQNKTRGLQLCLVLTRVGYRVAQF